MPVEDESVTVRANARIGVLLKGKYTLDKVLGIGGMATVYAATHRNGKEFAVKVLHAELSMRSETRTRFLREGYLANRVSHPGAVAVLDDDIGEDGGAFLVMELVQGQTLEAIWERHGCRLPLPLVAGVGLQLLDVLAAAHARGLIHRDIKPGNLMLTHDGMVKVLDFGIARLRDVAAANTTQTGMVMGTPAFMAPEQALAKAEEIDAQTDLWAAGASMFTLATGQLVHEGANSQQILVRAATSPARAFAEVMPGAPASLCEVVDRALAFEKSKRWSSAAGMREALSVASRKAFGVIPTPASIAAMVAEMAEHEKRTVLAPTEAPEVLALPSSGHVLTLASGRDPGPPPRRSPFAGAVTAEAVSSDSAVGPGVARPRMARARIVGVAALGVGGLLLIAMRGALSKDSKSVGTATHASTAAVPPAAPSALPPAVPSASSTWTPVLAAAPVETVVSTDALKPAPIAPPVAKHTAAPAPSVAKPSCDPPYEFDAKGDKRWKRECL
jgi:tRNA A-37 threonylcarbamoyl transferase component Bud32